MGIDNVFDPNQPYGSYRYYVQPCSEMSIEEPSYIRGVFKDDESHSRSSDYVIGRGFRRGSACKIILCIFLVMSFIGVVLAAITLAVILSQHNIPRRWSSPMELESEMILNGVNFTSMLRDNTSEEFKGLEKSFCSALHELFLADESPIKSEWSGCEVLEFLNGSVVTRFRIFVRQRNKADTEEISNMEEQLLTYLTKKLNDDGPWKPLKINLDSIKNFVIVDKTRGMTVKSSINITTITTSATTVEMVNTSNTLKTSEGIVSTHSSKPTHSSSQDFMLAKIANVISMESIATVGVRTEVLGISSTSTMSTVTGDYAGKIFTSTTDRYTDQANEVVPTTGIAGSSVFTKGLSKELSTGSVLDLRETTEKRTTTFSTERTPTKLDFKPSTSRIPIQTIVSTDSRTFGSTLTTKFLEGDSSDRIQTLSDTARTLTTVRTSDITEFFDDTFTTDEIAFNNISTQQEITTPNLLSSPLNLSESATKITAAIDLINTSIPDELVTIRTSIGINTMDFTDFSTISISARLPSATEHVTNRFLEKLLLEENRTLLLQTTPSSVELRTDFLAFTKGSTIGNSSHSTISSTTLAPEVSSLSEFELPISTLTEFATTFRSNDMIDSTVVPVKTSAAIDPSVFPSVIDRTKVMSDGSLSTHTSDVVNETRPEIEFSTLESRLSTGATKKSTDVSTESVEVITNTTRATISNVSDVVMTYTSLELSTRPGHKTLFVGTTVLPSITATNEVDITTPSVDNSVTEMQAASRKMITSTDAVQTSSVPDVIALESTLQHTQSSPQPDNVTIRMDQKQTTVPRDETPKINVTLDDESSTKLFLGDAISAESDASSTSPLNITSTYSTETDATKRDLSTSKVDKAFSHTISNIHLTTTSEATRAIEVVRPTVTSSTDKYIYTSVEASNNSSGSIYKETTDLPGEDIVSESFTKSTNQHLTISHLHHTTDIVISSVSHSTRQTDVITIESDNSTTDVSQNDKAQASTHPVLDPGVSSIDEYLSNGSSRAVYNETTVSASAEKEIISNISTEIKDKKRMIPQVHLRNENMSTSVPNSERQTLEIITAETMSSVFGTSKINSSISSNDEVLAERTVSVSLEVLHNETSNVHLENADKNVTVPLVQTTTTSVGVSTDSLSALQTTQSSGTEIVSPVLIMSQASTERILFSSISSADANWNVSSGTPSTEINHSQLTEKKIEANISSEITDQNVTEVQVQTTEVSVSSADANWNVSSGTSSTDINHSQLTEKEIVANISSEITFQNVTEAQVRITEGTLAPIVSHSAGQSTNITTKLNNLVLFATRSSPPQMYAEQSLVHNFTSIDKEFNITSGKMNIVTTDSTLFGKEIVSNMYANIADHSLTVPQLENTTDRTSSVVYSVRQTTDIITIEADTSPSAASQNDSSQASTHQGLDPDVSRNVGNLSNASSWPSYNKTTVSPSDDKKLTLSAETRDKNVIITTDRVVVKTASHSGRQRDESITTINSLFSASTSTSSLTSTDQVLGDAISPTYEIFNVSSGQLPHEAKKSLLNISAENGDHGVTIPYAQTPTKSEIVSTDSHSASQRTQTTRREIVSPVFNTSTSSPEQGIADGVSSAYTNVNVSSEIVSPFAGKEIVSNISVNIADKNSTITQHQSTTEMIATLVPHSDTRTTQSTIGEPHIDLSPTSTDQGLVDGASSALVIEETSLSGLINPESQHPPIVNTFVNELNATSIKTVENFRVTSEPHPLEIEHVSNERPFSDRNTHPLDQPINILKQHSNVTLPISNDTTLFNKVTTTTIFTSDTSENSTNVDTSQVTTTTSFSGDTSKNSTNVDTSQVRTTTSFNGDTSENSTNLDTSKVTTTTSFSGDTSENSTNVDTSKVTTTASFSGDTIKNSTNVDTSRVTTTTNFTGDTSKISTNLDTSKVTTTTSFTGDTSENSTNVDTSKVTTTTSFSGDKIKNSTNVDTNRVTTTTSFTGVLSKNSTNVDTSKSTTMTSVTGDTSKNAFNVDTSKAPILSVLSDSVNVSKHALKSIIKNNVWAMTTVATNSISRDHEVENVLANVMASALNVTENIADINLTGNFATTTENPLYKETVNDNVIETSSYILTSTSKYQTISGTVDVEFRVNGTSHASWNTPDNLADTNGVTLQPVTMNITINSTNTSYQTLPILSSSESSTISKSLNQSPFNANTESNTDMGRGDIWVGSILTNITSTPSPT